MKKKILVIALAVCLCAWVFSLGASAADVTVGDTSIEAPSETIDGTVYEGQLSTGATYFAYVPTCADYGGRATSSPILIVYGDEAYTAETAKTAAIDTGLAQIADIEKTPVIFVNPLGETWTEADAASYPAIRDMYTDSSYGDFTDEGKSVVNEDNGVAAGLYPGYCSRMYVFAEGAGADFAYKYLAPGIEARGQFFGTAVWKPASLLLMNPSSEETVDIEANTDRDVPVYVVNGSDALVASFADTNAEDLTVSVTSSVTDGFDKDVLLTAYNSLMEHWYTRDFAGQITLLPMYDAASMGFVETRVDLDVDGETLTYYEYLPETVGAAGESPIVFLFHGSGSTAEALVWTGGWLQTAKEDGVVLVSFDDYYTFSDEQLFGAIQDYVDANAFVDTSRIYLSGFSMGSRRTFALGSTYTDYFAGQLNMNLFSGVNAEPTGTIMPIFLTAGANSHLAGMEYPSADNIDALDYVLKVNGVTSDLDFDDQYTWGLEADKVTEYPSPDMEGAVVEVSEFAAKDGNVYTAFASNVNCVHEPIFTATQVGWDFIKQFSRNEDGSIAINGEGSHTADSASVFYDIDKDQWFFDEVKAAKDEGIIGGREGNLFDPYANITRAEFLTILYRMAGSPEAEPVEYSDVAADAYYADALGWAKAEGIAEGNKGAFEPNRSITRQEAAAMLYRYSDAAASDGEGIASFPDSADVSAWAVESMSWAVDNGIFGGRDDGTLDPLGNTTRAEAAAILTRLA